MEHKVEWKSLGCSLAIAIAVGATSTLISYNQMDIYTKIDKPILSPPKEYFPIIWCVLYSLMGISSYLIYQANDYMKRSALYMYIVQLLVNFIWTILFFNFHQYFLAFLILLLLWLMVVIMIASFFSIRKGSGYLQLPYITWLTFALYLNFGVCILNI